MVGQWLAPAVEFLVKSEDIRSNSEEVWAGHPHPNFMW